ncbi:hypothetical protein [Cryobacterium tepidiphilum]|jgi:hypothetical protein|uniref:YtxH domain-containing protein n=1 Tax=Cryobacterium tepidiphilum TaxID=2486026 RepID=A0A3M8LR59_9MICO|nr:hypothetical protein [Cryobacterium tepidiphilum]RNE66998.1 hypothetical protein EEJ31_01980 [Cryobacterium tepidiphilum]
MRGKLQFIVGGLIGYVLGARAGRQRYEQIAATAKDFWEAPPVQRRVHQVRDAALDVIGDTPVVLFRGVRKAVRSLVGSNRPASPSTDPHSTTTSRTHPGR